MDFFVACKGTTGVDGVLWDGESPPLGDWGGWWDCVIGDDDTTSDDNVDDGKPTTLCEPRPPPVLVDLCWFCIIKNEN